MLQNITGLILDLSVVNFSFICSNLRLGPRPKMADPRNMSKMKELINQMPNQLNLLLEFLCLGFLTTFVLELTREMEPVTLRKLCLLKY